MATAIERVENMKSARDAQAAAAADMQFVSRSGRRLAYIDDRGELRLDCDDCSIIGKYARELGLWILELYPEEVSGE